MTLDISPVLSGRASSLSFEYEIDPTGDEFALPPRGVTSLDPIAVSATVKSAGITIKLEAEAKVSYHAVCDRCTEEFDGQFTFSYERYVKSEEDRADTSDDDEEDSWEDDDVLFDGEGKISFDREIVEEAMLSFPNALLCREDCAGICEYCGQNLNLADCGCREREKNAPDPRWEALASLYADDEEKSPQ